MTEAQLDALRDRWRAIRPGQPMTERHRDDVTALMLQVDLEAGTRAAFAAMLAEVADCPDHLPRGLKQRAAALLQLHNHPDY